MSINTAKSGDFAQLDALCDFLHRPLHLELKNNYISLQHNINIRTKRGANNSLPILKKAGIQNVAILGNKSQTRHQRALPNFKTGRVEVVAIGIIV